MPRALRVLAGVAACLLMGAAAAAPAPDHQPREFGDRPSVAELTELGRAIFNDPGLSASGRMACATCHSPAYGYGPPPGLVRRGVAMGGARADQAGLRAVPSLRYLNVGAPFELDHFDDDELHGEDAGPTGGLTWDGRADRIRDQVRLPLFAANEMANGDARGLARRVARAPYAARLREATSAPGGDVFQRPEDVVAWVATALEVFLQDPATFHPYSSRYDDVLRGKAQLSEQEARGMAVFIDPERGNCASCHPARMRAGALPRFTDDGFGAVGVPRNRAIPANRRAAFHDLGLCGPLRTDLHDAQEPADLCGQFKVPSLRNVAVRSRFFHNGVMSSLRQVLEFYATRDTDPQRWYAAGAARQGHGPAPVFDDLPERWQGNVNRLPPFGSRPDGQARLSAQDIDDLLAFLATLTDADLKPRPAPATAKARPAAR